MSNNSLAITLNKQEKEGDIFLKAENIKRVLIIGGGTTDVPVTTLDAFAASASLDFVHVLKTDTQGFDLEILRGAETLLANGKIGIIQTEVNLADLYEGQATFDSLYRHMADRDYAALGFYRMRVRDGLLGWMDALFIHRRFYEQRHRGRPGAIERVSRS
jgi:hypothetical protein